MGDGEKIWKVVEASSRMINAQVVVLRDVDGAEICKFVDAW